jgi:hypothetical protein
MAALGDSCMTNLLQAHERMHDPYPRCLHSFLLLLFWLESTTYVKLRMLLLRPKISAHLTLREVTNLSSLIRFLENSINICISKYVCYENI